MELSHALVASMSGMLNVSVSPTAAVLAAGPRDSGRCVRAGGPSSSTRRRFISSTARWPRASSWSRATGVRPVVAVAGARPVAGSAAPPWVAPRSSNADTALGVSKVLKMPMA